MEMLTVVLLTIRNDRLGLTELVEDQDDLASLDLLDFAAEQLTDPVPELLADLGALALAHALDDPLLRGLHREAPEPLEGHLLLEHVTHFEVRILELGLLEGDLTARILHRLDDLAEPHDLHRALEFIHAHLEPHVWPELAHQGRVDPILQEIQQFPAVNLLACRQLANRGEHLNWSGHPSLLRKMEVPRPSVVRDRPPGGGRNGGHGGNPWRGNKKCGGTPHITRRAEEPPDATNPNPTPEIYAGRRAPSIREGHAPLAAVGHRDGDL